MRPERLATLAAAMSLVAACGESPAPGDDPRTDPRDAARVALGARVYAQHCAACHGAKLEGQPDWRKRLPPRRGAPAHAADAARPRGLRAALRPLPRREARRPARLAQAARERPAARAAARRERPYL